MALNLNRIVGPDGPRMIDRRRQALSGPGTQNRGQTEPLAALVSVAVVCLALGLYVGVFGDRLPEVGTDRDLSAPTMEAVWEDVRTDGTVERRTDLRTAIDQKSLPEGHAVSITVTTIDEDGRLERTGRISFDPRGEPTSVEPPERADRVTRPVAVRLEPGDVRPGRLTVEVWDEQ